MLRRLADFFDRLKRPLFYQATQSTYLTQAFYVLAELGVAELLADRPMTAEEMAGEIEADAERLRRVLRAAASFGVFAEDRQGRFRMTRRARTLRRDWPGPLRNWLVLMAQPATWSVVGSAQQIVKTGQNGFQIAHGAGGLYAYCQQHSAYAAEFARAQAAWTRWQASAVVGAYRFARHQRLVDLGAGSGILSAAILRSAPGLTATLVDVPATLAQAEQHLRAAGVLDRCVLSPTSIFDRAPEGGDLYILKHVLRDWDDDRAASILSACRDSMAIDAKLLIMDAVLNPTNRRDRVVKLLDLEQMFWLDGKLRTHAEWIALLDRCGLKLVRQTKTSIVDLRLLEVHRR